MVSSGNHEKILTILLTLSKLKAKKSPIAGGNKSRPYLFCETTFVVAGFIPASKG